MSLFCCVVNPPPALNMFFQEFTLTCLMILANLYLLVMVAVSRTETVTLQDSGCIPSSSSELLYELMKTVFKRELFNSGLCDYATYLIVFFFINFRIKEIKESLNLSSIMSVNQQINHAMNITGRTLHEENYDTNLKQENLSKCT